MNVFVLRTKLIQEMHQFKRVNEVNYDNTGLCLRSVLFRCSWHKALSWVSHSVTGEYWDVSNIIDARNLKICHNRYQRWAARICIDNELVADDDLYLINEND